MHELCLTAEKPETRAMEACMALKGLMPQIYAALYAFIGWAIP